LAAEDRKSSMDPAYISAFTALAGSVVGGLTSLGASWLTQRKQVMAQRVRTRYQHAGRIVQGLHFATRRSGGLTLAAFITLLLVPVLYSIFVLDLKLIRWDVEAPSPIRAQAAI
jgi:hypothetical protein